MGFSFLLNYFDSILITDIGMLNQRKYNIYFRNVIIQLNVSIIFFVNCLEQVSFECL